MERTIHGKEIKTTTYGVSIDEDGWSKSVLEEALSNWRTGTDEDALRVFGINISQLCDVFLGAIEMLKNEDMSETCKNIA